MTELTQLCVDRFGAGVEIASRSGLVLFFTAAAMRLMRRSSAAARHLVWTAAVVGVLTLPALSNLQPIPVPVPALFATNRIAPDTAPAVTPVTEYTAPMVSVATATPEADVAGSELPAPAFTSRPPLDLHTLDLYIMPAPAPPMSWSEIATRVWLIGVAVCSLPWILGCFSLWLLSDAAKPLPEKLARELQELALRLVGRPVAGLQSANRNIPMTWGIWRSVILLPADACNWTVEKRRLVFLHELAHIRRRDCLTQLLGQIARSLHWFNPLAWWALSRMRLEQEQACDDFVLSSGATAEEYAAELLSVTARLPRVSWDSAVSLAMGRAHRLENRLNAILDPRRNRRTPSAIRIVTGLTLLSGLIVTLAIVQPREVRSEVATNIQQPATSTDKSTSTPSKVSQEKAAEKDGAPGKGELPKEQQDLRSVIELIEKHSVHPTNSSQLNEAAIRGMMESLKDQYSTYLSEKDMQSFNTAVEAKLVGIGIMLSQRDGKLYVDRPLREGPAFAHLKPGDEILAINGQPAPGDLAQAAAVIRGPEGTDVSLKIRRGSDELSFTVTRRTLKLSQVKGFNPTAEGEQYWLDANQKLAYIRIESFSQRLSEDLKAALKKLTDEGCKGVVLDLRRNPGGLLNVCIEVAQLFMKDAVVVQTKGKVAEQNSTFKTGVDVTYPDLPLVLVVDRYTASAAEVLTAALKDNQRCIVVGERTFGKGSVQSVIPLGPNGNAIRLSTASMLSPSGAPLHREPGGKHWGVDPHDGYFVPMTTEQRQEFERKGGSRHSGYLPVNLPVTPEFLDKYLADPALAAAMQTLQEKIKTGEFKKTGSPVALQDRELAMQDELRKQRDEVRKKLDQLNAELGEK